MRKSFFLIGMVGLLMAGSAHAQIDSEKLVVPEKTDISDAFKPTPKRIQTPRPADDEKNKQIITTLLKQTDWFPHITVSVKDGLVELKGAVDEKSQLDWLIQTIDRLPTVLAVIDKTNVPKKAATDLSPAIDELKKSVDRTKRSLPRVAVGILLIFLFGAICYFLNQGVKRLWQRRTRNPFLQNTLSRLTMLPIVAMFIFMIFKVVGLTGLAATIVGGTGLIGIVLGFAFRGVAENYLAGVMLAIRSPFTRGDEIKIGEYAGFVQMLSMRGTTLVDYEGNQLLIPNSVITGSTLTNISANPTNRVQFYMTIDVRTSFLKTQEIILATIRDTKQVLKDPAPTAFAESFRGSNIVINVRAWFNSREIGTNSIRSILIAKIRDALIENNIFIADDVQMIQVRKKQIRSVHKEKEPTLQEEQPSPAQLKEDLLKQADKNPIEGHENNLLKS